MGQSASTLHKVATASVVSDEMQELQARIDAMAEQSKVINADKCALQEHMKELQSKGKACTEMSSRGKSWTVVNASAIS